MNVLNFLKAHKRVIGACSMGAGIAMIAAGIKELIGDRADPHYWEKQVAEEGWVTVPEETFAPKHYVFKSTHCTPEKGGPVVSVGYSPKNGYAFGWIDADGEPSMFTLNVIELFTNLCKELARNHPELKNKEAIQND